ncbi:MAG: hypothetical protein LBT32_05250 [Peptococcaceae bacterium]|jgi:hypothetical protein|nr:hypothetical protein [Peptococcaceae bacterium]
MRENDILYGIPVIMLITGLVQLIKQICPSGATKYMGLVALIIGVAIAVIQGQVYAWPLVQSVLTGMYYGLSSAGLYSTGKNSLAGQRRDL